MLNKFVAFSKDFFDIPAVIYIWVVILSMGFVRALEDRRYFWVTFTAVCLVVEYIDFIITNKGRKV